MVEQWTENPCVPGSIPGGTTKTRIAIFGFFVFNTFLIYFFTAKVAKILFNVTVRKHKVPKLYGKLCDKESNESYQFCVPTVKTVGYVCIVLKKFKN